MKKIFALLLVLSLVLICAACGQAADSAEDAEAVESQTTEEDTSEEEGKTEAMESQTAEEDTSEEEGKTEAMESQTAEEDTSGGDQPGEAEAVDESSDFGLLSADEIAGLEALYGQNPSGLLESLGLTEADAASNDTSVTLTDPRIIGDRAFTVRYDFYTDDPGGMVEVMYSLGLSDDAENTVALVRTIYEAAVSAYGEPSAYEGQEGRISQSLEEIEASGISGIYQEDWAVGEQTRLNMTVMLYEDNNMDNNMVVISLTYQLEE